jgi:Ca-activated chloride channel family protein
LIHSASVASRATVRVTGIQEGRRVAFEVPANLDGESRHNALPAVWARARIQDWGDEMTYSPVAAEIAPQIRRLALQYGLVSDFTAFVAVDASARTAGDSGTTVVQPVPVPQGVKHETSVQEKP